MVAEVTLPSQSGAGWPLVPLEDVVEEASFWADLATPEELQAYAAVCLARLPPAGQAGLVTHLHRRAA